jgi:chorismate mutase
MDEITKIRKEIDKIDKKIATLLKKRFSKVAKIGQIKTHKKIKIKDKKREEKILSTFDTDSEKKIFKTIIKESKKIQDDTLT